jgi:hypothetical protein
MVWQAVDAMLGQAAAGFWRLQTDKDSALTRRPTREAKRGGDRNRSPISIFAKPVNSNSGS